MAILWVHEALSSGSGSGEHDSGNRYTRVFDVLSDSYADNAYTIANADDGTLAIPAPYTHFAKGNDTDYTSIVTRITPERDDRYPLLWHVRVEYTVLRGTGPSGEWPAGTTDETGRLPDIRIWGIPVAEIVARDINDTPIANSAGDQYTPLPEDIYYIKAFEISFPLRTYDLDWWEKYEDSVNADMIWGREPGTLLMAGPPSGNRKVNEVGTYYEVRIEIQYNRKGWKKRIPDMGKHRLVTAAGGTPSTNTPAAGRMPITDQAGRPVMDDVPLDGHGQPLGLNQAWVIKEWAVKIPMAWGPLNLPALNVTW